MSLATAWPGERTGSSNFVAARYRLVWLLAAVYWGVSGADARGAGRAGAGGRPDRGAGTGPRPWLGRRSGPDRRACDRRASCAVSSAPAGSASIAHAAHRAAVRVALALVVYGLTYLAAVEYFFFDEFNARFNFVAVEYLIYPHEVFINIWQSYPVGRALAASGVVTGLMLWLLRPRITAALADTRAASKTGHFPRSPRSCCPPLHCGARQQTVGEQNRVADELTVNGLYAFFDAAQNSRLDYTHYLSDDCAC